MDGVSLEVPNPQRTSGQRCSSQSQVLSPCSSRHLRKMLFDKRLLLHSEPSAFVLLVEDWVTRRFGDRQAENRIGLGGLTGPQRSSHPMEEKFDSY